jgi:hypothetical protein
LTASASSEYNFAVVISACSDGFYRSQMRAPAMQINRTREMALMRLCGNDSVHAARRGLTDKSVSESAD